MREKSRMTGFYEDKYFKPGNKSLKIKEGFITLVGWAFVMGLMTLVLISSMANIDSRLPKLIPHDSSFYEINHMAFILFTLSIISFLISIFLTIMNNYRNKSFYNSVSILDMKREKKREQLFEDYVTERFGNRNFRHNVRAYEVSPEQCLEKNTYQKLYNKYHVNDVD
ncbi:hypothetical protein [Companilactobacillus ginsenosidimutans]|uniref:Uncharacterized protein n=1 Tax=Companilactobacillus ginsenosidimutans TaxID=1007676 RepID=A0A0H4QMK1_9LACO|nr:hypothetical protein [Companilactobacillus ginsenosidimutans]AKP67913.1 hypothetical protein ABM34_10480 [Companilactobacillus ginsenosidimutans]